MSKRLWITTLALLASLSGVVSAGAASAPTIERFEIDRSQPDPGLTAACGVAVTTHVQGHVVVRIFAAGGTGPVDLVTISLAVTATAGDNTYRFRNVGADSTHVGPDGTAIFLSTGQLPFEWTGALKLDLATGEAILEPSHTTGGMIGRACAALTA
jgi:hypothetical protein